MLRKRKLSEDQVKIIRILYKRGSRNLGLRGLSDHFSVSKTAIRYVVNFLSYKYIN
jgi:hypothetical protein